MKPINLITFFLSAILILVVIKLSMMDREMTWMKQDIEELQKRDSLVANHYGKCSFISKEDVAVGFDGYLYSVTARKNKMK